MSHPSLYDNVDSVEMTEQRGSKVEATVRGGALSGVKPHRRRKTLPHITGFLCFCAFLSLVLLLVGLLHVSGTAMETRQQLENLRKEFSLFKRKECSCGQCPPNWHLFNRACYYFSNQTGTWQFAKQQCSTEHSHLLVINSSEEQNFITEAANNSMYWIGLRDIGGGNWTWVDDTICRSSSTFWSVGEPNNWNGKTEDCVHIEDEGRWNDIQCSANLSWICEKLWGNTHNSDQLNSDQLNSDQLNSDQLNSTQINSTQINSTQINSTQINSNQINSTQINSTQINSTQINSTQINSTQINSTQINLTQINSTQINSTQINSTQINSTQINSTQINSTQINSTQINSTQINSNQINSTQINSTQINSTQINLTQINSTQINSTQINSTQINSTQLRSTQLRSTQFRSTQLRSTLFVNSLEFSVSVSALPYRMAGEQAYDGFDNFSLENEPKQKRAKQIPGSRFKSIFSAKVLMVLIFILLSVVLILLVTGVIKCSETNETVEEFQSQSQMQVSNALNNVSQKADLEDFAQLIQVKVTEMGASVMAELSKKITSLKDTITKKLETFQRPECQNLQCPLKWISFNGSCYFFSTVKATWSSSKMYCTIQTSNLLVINTIEEQHFITMESNTKEFWIGLSDHEQENKWKWVDGTDYEATPKFWSVNEPNNANSGEDCAQVSSSGMWNDNNCSGKRLYICEQEVKSD
ncbi:uncharacterized protein LOC119956998 [Scyliorhinus canicula]|uniref:uncharacterized protein LOC119956998 n=1 Tax=Scyliorhinus canicula TaxID=7830 RepID=UPI0018F35826|nr:uncharacterized protein LOC119956998 [Scyliorhinus canicula]